MEGVRRLAFLVGGSKRGQVTALQRCPALSGSKNLGNKDAAKPNVNKPQCIEAYIYGTG